MFTCLAMEITTRRMAAKSDHVEARGEPMAPIDAFLLRFNHFRDAAKASPMNLRKTLIKFEAAIYST